MRPTCFSGFEPRKHTQLVRISVLYLFAVLLLLCPASARAQGIATLSNYLIQGDSAYKAFANHEALTFYEKAFDEDSTFNVRVRLSRTYYDFGLDLMASNNNDEARAYF